MIKAGHIALATCCYPEKTHRGEQEEQKITRPALSNPTPRLSDTRHAFFNTKPSEKE